MRMPDAQYSNQGRRPDARALLAHISFALLATLLVACAPSHGEVQEISVSQLATRISEGQAPLILDVRSTEEFKEGHVPGAINIPYDKLAEIIQTLNAQPDEEIVVYCRSGRRAGIAEDILLAAGYTNLKDMNGHMNAWHKAGLPLSK